MVDICVVGANCPADMTAPLRRYERRLLMNRSKTKTTFIVILPAAIAISLFLWWYLLLPQPGVYVARFVTDAGVTEVGWLVEAE